MRRGEQPEIEEVGQDSFLDVVSNIVGILILLVVIVGAAPRATLVERRNPPRRRSRPAKWKPPPNKC